jgi:hypothetical protein
MAAALVEALARRSSLYCVVCLSVSGARQLGVTLARSLKFRQKRSGFLDPDTKFSKKFAAFSIEGFNRLARRAQGNRRLVKDALVFRMVSVKPLELEIHGDHANARKNKSKE